MIPVLILTALSLVTHLIFFGHPASVVFDEVHNGSFISAYATGQYYFDVHPPLAKLLVKFFGDILGVSYNADFAMIGNTLPWEIIILRILPVLAGIILPLIIYFICRHINMSKLASFSAGILICLENSLIVQSRFIMFDSIMMLFGFSALLFYLLFRKNEQKKSLLVCSAILAAAAFSIKWTGFAFPLLIVIMEIIRTRKFLSIARFISVYALIGLIFYVSVFAVHFSYLKHTGKGDVFMSDRFQKTLIGNPHASNPSIQPKGFFGKFIELNLVMYESNKTLTAGHAYGSKWHTWPLMTRPIFYWQTMPEAGSYIYFLGNPLLYWLGTLAILCLIFYSVFKSSVKQTALLIAMGFLVNFIPFIFIGRVMFLYHYQSALIFSILAIAFLIDRIKHHRARVVTFVGIMAASLMFFIYFSPLTYGLPLDDSRLNARMWLSTWR